MKKIYFLFLTLIITSIGYSQDISLNGGFENWTAGVPDSWTTIDFSSTDLTENTDANFITEGSSSAFVNLTTQSQGDTDIRQSVTLTAGTTYTVSMDVYSFDNQARARIFDSSYSTNTYTDPEVQNQWQTISFDYTATANGDVEFGIRFYDISSNWLGGTTFYIDNFQIVEASTPSIAITSPSDGEIFTNGDVDVSFSVQNFTVASTTGGGDGHIHYYLDGDTTPVMVYDTNPISLTGLADGDHTIVMELVDNAHAALDPAVSTSVDFTVTSIVQIADIAALRTAFANGGGGSTVYELLSTPTVTFAQTYRNQKYIQDATAGILIDDQPGTITTTFTQGDGVTGLIGTVTEFNGVLQFVPNQDANVATGTTITPQTVDIATLLTNWEDYESELVEISSVTFADADGSATFSTGTDYDISDGSTMVFRTQFYNADYISTTIPSVVSSLVVIVGEYNSTPQVYARELNDFTLNNNTFEATSFNVFPNPATAGYVRVTSRENNPIAVEIFDLLGKVVLSQTTQNNEVNVSSLNAGIYVIKMTQGNATATQKLIVK